MAITQRPVFTVGHSNHSPEAFLRLLLRHNVDQVVDVRSTPYSRYAPHFNHESLNGILENVGIGYTFMGEGLGGRPTDRLCYDANGRVLYNRIADTDPFDDGIRCIVRGADERRLALMCTEKEPLECHRTLLIARTLTERGVAVAHILADGSLENHDTTMDRLMDMLNLPHNGDMFRSRANVIADALDNQAQKVAYVSEKPPAYGD